MRTIVDKCLREALVLLLLTGQGVFGQTSWMGMKFQVGSSPLVITSLGRIHIAGNNGTHQLKLVDAATGKDLPNSQVNVSMSGGTANQFKYSSLAAPVALNPGSVYYLVSSETAGGDQWYDASSTLTTDNAATCLGGVYWDGGTWLVKGNTNNAFVPLDFTYGGLLDPVNVSNSTGGLTYAYYENNWQSILPDLTYYAPLKTGSVSNFDLSVKKRNDQIVIKYTGFISVPADGNYTFTTNSDDESKLYIHDVLLLHNRQILRDVSGSIGLKAGKHPIKVEYLNAFGGELLSVNYTGPGVVKQPIPPSTLYRGEAGPISNPGANFSGYYKIIARHSGKALDVSGFSTADNAQVHQWDYFGGPNQQWLLTHVGDGYYRLTAKHSTKALALNPNPASNGGFTDITSDGVKMVQRDNTNSDDRLWNIEAVGDGYYKLINKASRKALDVSRASNDNGMFIHQWQYIGAPNQQWQLQSVESASPPVGPETSAIYELTPQCAGCTDKRLDVTGGAGSRTQIRPSNNQNSQRWKLITISAGIIELQSQSATGNSLDVDNGVGPMVQVHPSNASNAQRWKLIPVDEANAIYELEPQSTLGKRLDVDYSWGPGVQIFEANRTSAQRWKLTKVSNGARVKAESVESTQLSVYPNPAQTEVTLESEEELANVQVFNIIGMLSLSKANLASSRVIMEVASLPKGMYIIKAVTKKGNTLVDKLIVNH